MISQAIAKRLWSRFRFLISVGSAKANSRVENGRRKNSGDYRDTPKYPLLLMVKAFQEKLFYLRFERMGVR